MALSARVRSAAAAAISFSPSTCTIISSPHFTPSVITRKILDPSTKSEVSPATTLANRTTQPDSLALREKSEAGRACRPTGEATVVRNSCMGNQSFLGEEIVYRADVVFNIHIHSDTRTYVKVGE